MFVFVVCAVSMNELDFRLSFKTLNVCFSLLYSSMFRCSYTKVNEMDFVPPMLKYITHLQYFRNIVLGLVLDFLINPQRAS